MRIGSRGGIDQRGFTLGELLIALAVLGLVMAGILTLVMTGNESYLTGANQVEIQAAVRAVVDRVTRDVRQAGYDPKNLGGFDAIINPTATSFLVQIDWNGNGAVDPLVVVQVPYIVDGVATNVGRGEQITYSVAGGTLTRQESAVDATPQVLLTSVAQATEGGALQPYFQYLAADGTVTATPSLIRAIIVRLTAGVQVVVGQPPATWQAGKVEVTMRDQIRLRNR